MTEVTALFVKWMTHDLATPAATVLTASELLGANADAEINGLVHDGARRLVARLRLIRAAFAPGAGPMAATALQRLLREGIETTPIGWTRPADASGPDAALIAGSALLLNEMAKGAAFTVTPGGVAWDAPQPGGAALVRHFASLDPADGRSALAALVIDAGARAGRTVTATTTGIGWA